MIKRLPVLGGLLLLTTAAFAERWVLRDVIPVTSPELPSPADIVVVDGIIAAIVAAGEAEEQAGDRVLGLADRFVLPGLFDMHVHLEHFDDPVVLDQFLAAGITTVRSMNGGEQVLAWRNAIARGERLGPRILVATPIIEGRQSYWPGSERVGTARDARRLLERLEPGDFDFLKIYHTLERSTFRALVKGAGDAALPVIGHVPASVDLSEAASRMASIEHLHGFGRTLIRRQSARSLPGFVVHLVGGPLDERAVDRTVRALAASGTALTPTLVQIEQVAPPAVIAARLAAADPASVPASVRDRWDPDSWRPGTRELIARVPPDGWDWWHLARENRQELVRRMAAAGIPILAGSDTPAPFIAPGEGLHDELAALEAAGLERRAVIAAATTAPGAFLDAHLAAAKPSGRLEVGARADLLILKADPTATLGALRRIHGLLLAGRWLDAEALQRGSASARETHAQSSPP
ncbi:MAG: amidohydrolase family protein [Pseudomonadota bacterium]